LQLPDDLRDQLKNPLGNLIKDNDPNRENIIKKNLRIIIIAKIANPIDTKIFFLVAICLMIILAKNISNYGDIRSSK